MATKRITKDYSTNTDYISWLKTTDRNLSEQELDKIEQKIKDEVQLLLTLSPKDRLLYLKKVEVDNWVPTQTIKDLLWVERLIFKTKGRSDFRRINPELIEIHDDYELSTLNIWGEKHSITLKMKQVN